MGYDNLHGLSSACKFFFHTQFSSSSYLVTFKQIHRKNQPNSSQASHKNYCIFSSLFGSFFTETKLLQTSPSSPYPVSLSPNPVQRGRRKVKGGGESVNLLFALFPSVISTFSRGERDENWEGGAGP